jgi:hypothetical protein
VPLRTSTREAVTAAAAHGRRAAPSAVAPSPALLVDPGVTAEGIHRARPGGSRPAGGGVPPRTATPTPPTSPTCAGSTPTPPPRRVCKGLEGLSDLIGSVVWPEKSVSSPTRDGQCSNRCCPRNALPPAGPTRTTARSWKRSCGCCAPARRGGPQGGGEPPQDETLGRSRGGLSSKLHLRVEGGGRPLVILVTRQGLLVSERAGGVAPPAGVRSGGLCRAQSGGALRESAQAVRRVATRYEKRACNYLAMVKLAAALIRL